MPAESVASRVPSRERMLLASVVVALTVLVLWAFIEYRTQPPEPPRADVTRDR